MCCVKCKIIGLANYVFPYSIFVQFWMLTCLMRPKSVILHPSHLVGDSVWQYEALLFIDYSLPGPNERSASRVSRHSLHPDENFTHFTHLSCLHSVLWMLVVSHFTSLFPLKKGEPPTFISPNIMNSIPPSRAHSIKILKDHSVCLKLLLWGRENENQPFYEYIPCLLRQFLRYFQRFYTFGACKQVFNT